jgi:hypothetical protein
MHRLRLRKPSPATAVAVAALIVALGGTSYAAFGPFNGNKIIKKHSLSGNRLKKGTITGTQVNLSKLGKVPNASNADTAANANKLGGFASSAYEPASHWIRTGIVKASVGQTVPLTKFGPFTLTLQCVAGTGANIDGQIHATSTEANSDGYGTAMTTAGTDYRVLNAFPIGGTTTFSENDDNAADFYTPSGISYIADLTVGQNWAAAPAQCFANALVSPS